MSDKDNVRDLKEADTMKLGQSEEESEEKEEKSEEELMKDAIGLSEEESKKVERKLFLARFLDYFSEETLDFIYKDKTFNKYKEELNSVITALEQEGDEEDKLLIKSMEDKRVIETLDRLKSNAESLAKSEGIEQAYDKKMRKWSIIITIPMFGLLIVLILFGNAIPIDPLFLFPLLCVFCMAPSLIRGQLMKKWFQFKEEHKKEFYQQNRNDILVLKDYVGEVLNNLRAKLIDKKVPLQLIKFVLHSRDYENLNLLNQKSGKGATQYVFNFAYPEGMEPFPVPKELMQKYQKPEEVKKQISEEPEKNFIVLTDVKAKDGIIEDFVPTLKDRLADKINDMLNECEFQKAQKDFSVIMPNYSPKNAIYCVCGEVLEVSSVQLCNWRDEFKFYLFEGEECDCGEKVYALSVMDDSDQIPAKLKDIFRS